MSPTEELALPLDSLVVVTGANGFIASHVCDQLLQAGYRVRGTVRNISKSSWMEYYFNEKYGTNKFKLAEIPDMAADGSFDEAIIGASGFAHVATPVMQGHDPNKVIPIVIDGTLNALKAAAKEPMMQRFVLTSSSTAAASPQPNVEFSMDESTWNEEAVKQAWAPPPYEGIERMLNVYSASKTQGEQEAWKWIKENEPNFVFNAVLPNCNMGKALSPKHQGTPSTTGWIKAAWEGFGDNQEAKEMPPQYYVNVQDTARIHLAALTYPDVKNERLFAFAAPFNWNDVLASFRKTHPDHKVIDDLPNLGKDLSKVANERAEELLKRLGRPGWTSLDDSLNDAVAGFV